MRSTIVVLSILLAVPAARAADTDQRENRLVVRHYDNAVDLRSGTGQVVDSKTLQTNLRYDLRRTDTILVSVEQTNPLLFTYEWNTKDPTNTSNYTAATQFATAVKTLVELLGGLLPETKQSAIADQNYCAKLEANAQAAQLAPDDLRFCRAGVTPKVIGTLIEHTNEIHTRAAEIPRLIKSSAVSWDEALAVKKRAAQEWADTDERITAINTHFKAIYAANRQRAGIDDHPVQLATLRPIVLAQRDPTGTGTRPPRPNQPRNPAPPVSSLTDEQRRSQPLAAEVRRLLDDKAPLDADIAALRHFLPLAKAIGDPVPFKPPIAYNAKQDQPAVLTITRVPLEAPTVDTKKFATGDFAITFRPGGPVLYEYGLAGIYSFLEVPQFSAKAGEDEKLRIVRTDNGDAVSGTTAAPTLTITPRAWDDPQFSAGFQLGISPLKDKIGLFLGSRIKIYDLFTFGAGITYQQTKRLARGVSIGDVVEAADEIKTTNVFKPAAYVSIGVELSKK